MLKQKISLDEYLIKHTTFETINEVGLQNLFRSMLEPVLETTDKIKSDVLLKVTNREMFLGLLTRLSFSEVSYTDYIEEIRDSESLDETDFLLVAASDFISFLAWKQDSDRIKFWTYTNCEEINEIIDILNENSNKDLSYLKDSYSFNTDTSMTNFYINKLVGMLQNSQVKNSDVVEVEDSESQIKLLSNKARHISHELKNQLSICDLYLGVMRKYCENNGILEDTIDRSIECMNKSVKLMSNLIGQLKVLNSKELKLYRVDIMLESVSKLVKAYVENKNINFELENDVKEEIFVDQTLFMSAIINIVKNASEAFDDLSREDNLIRVSSRVENDNVVIQISNNAKPIENPEAIFNEGITTKSTGSGLGLFISKQSVESMCGKLDLVKSDNDSTVFELKFCL